MSDIRRGPEADAVDEPALEALSGLPLEGAPPPALEDEVVSALRRARLLREPTARDRGVPRWWLAAATLLAFGAGVAAVWMLERAQSGASASAAGASPSVVYALMLYQDEVFDQASGAD
jgi:hypothetical protein